MLPQLTKRLAVPTCMAFLLAGCGGTDFPTAKVLGKVVFEDAPVTGGTVTFVPINADGSPRDGKAAVGTIGDGGVFELRTYEDGDGAITGHHKVVYSPPVDLSDETRETAIEIKLDANGQEVAAEPPASEGDTGPELGVAENSSIVEVKDVETNEVKIELVPISSNDGGQQY
jgi:hypothetical protein